MDIIQNSLVKSNQFHLISNFNRFCQIDSFQDLKENSSCLIRFCKLSSELGKMPSNKTVSSKSSEKCIKSQDNIPISFISSLLQSLNIFFVVMLIKTLHFTSITFRPSCKCNFIFLGRIERMNYLISHFQTWTLITIETTSFLLSLLLI